MKKKSSLIKKATHL